MKEGSGKGGGRQHKLIIATKKHWRGGEARKRVKRLDFSLADRPCGSRHGQGQGVSEKRMCGFLRGP